MTRVKICGITTVEDATDAVEAGVDALGFIFAPGTPRAVPPDTVQRIVATLPPFIATVGVFVDRPLQELLEIATRCRLQAIQLHGEESAELARSLPVKVIKAIRVKDAESLRPIATYPAHAFLLDAFVEGKPGGTGSVLPWDLATQVKGPARIILSGGLRPDSVDQAVRLVRPYAVDVSSGVEMRPGRKDRQKVREFIAAVRRADQS
jgi:phosphoribosylanthranilate isomerase